MSLPPRFWGQIAILDRSAGDLAHPRRSVRPSPACPRPKAESRLRILPSRPRPMLPALFT